MDERNDTELVRAVRRGQRSAYAELLRRHYDRVFLVCLGVVGNVHDAEDVAQDVTIKGLEEIRQLRDAGQFDRWIVKIARNLSINHLRRRVAVQRLADRMCGEAPVGATPRGCPGRAQGPAPADDLHQAVAKLPLDLRLPLVMYYFDGRSVKTVARTLDISTSGVYAKLRTALKELHEVLTTQGERP